MDIRLLIKLVYSLHFEQYGSVLFAPWNGSVLDWFSPPQLKLDWVPNLQTETGLVWGGLNCNWAGLGQAELELDWLLKTW